MELNHYVLDLYCTIHFPLMYWVDHADQDLYLFSTYVLGGASGVGRVCGGKRGKN
jgi:hypothetical protein